MRRSEFFGKAGLIDFLRNKKAEMALFFPHQERGIDRGRVIININIFIIFIIYIYSPKKTKTNYLWN